MNVTNYDFDLGVIGGGAAGLTVAAGSAQFGAKTYLVEAEKELGGDCLHFGCVPSKTLIKTAHVYHMMKKGREFGLPETNPGPVDFRKVAQRIQSVIGTIQKHDSEERFCGLGVQVEIGRPVFVDEYSVLVNGKTVSAKNWVIATGSSPSVPPFKGLAEISFLTNKDIFSLDHLPRSMIIFGAGPVAVEMAQAFSRLGSKVDVVQRSGQILSREDKDMADLVMEVLASEGITFHLNSSVLHVNDKNGEKEALIKSGDQEPYPLKAEKILVALGRTSNMDSLGLDKAGVEFNSKGLQVDRRLRTTQKHIYGAGDVTGAFQYTHAAGYEGGIAVSNAILHLPRKADYTLMPWCTFTDPELAGIGMNEKQAQAAGLEYSVWTEEFKDNDRFQAEGESAGKIKMILNEHEKLIGVQILGPRAGELINEWVAIMAGKVRLSTLASAVHPYPTLGEINKRVAGTFFSPKIYSDKVKKGLKFFFHLKGRACG